MGKFEKQVPFWKRLTGALLEILAELAAAAVIFAIGAGVVSLIGLDKAVDQMDSDLVLLLGALVVLLIFGIVFATVEILRRKKRKKGTDPTVLS